MFLLLNCKLRLILLQFFHFSGSGYWSLFNFVEKSSNLCVVGLNFNSVATWFASASESETLDVSLYGVQYFVLMSCMKNSRQWITLRHLGAVGLTLVPSS